MADRSARAARVVCCGVLVAALVVGALSPGSVVATPDGTSPSPTALADRSVSSPGADGAGAVFGESTAGASDRAESPAIPRLAGASALQPQSNGTDVQPRYLTGFDRVKTRIDLTENGSASVQVTYRYLLPDNESSDEWESLRDDVESSPEAYVAGERERWNDTVAAGQNATDREMTASGFDVRTAAGTTPQAYGDVIVSFRWSSFAAVEPKWIGAGDALAQFALEDGATLRMGWPDGYALQSASPDPDDTDREAVVGWHGDETDFLEDEPWITLLEEGSPPASDGGPDSQRSVVPFLVAGLLILTLGSGAAWWTRRSESDGADSPPADPAEDAPTVETPPALMSNEERVLTLLEANGGRMKQQTVVTELDWTEAKTSQVVGELRDADAIEVFRLGRENVLALPDRETEPNGADSADGGDEDAATS